MDRFTLNAHPQSSYVWCSRDNDGDYPAMSGDLNSAAPYPRKLRETLFPEMPGDFSHRSPSLWPHSPLAATVTNSSDSTICISTPLDSRAPSSHHLLGFQNSFQNEELFLPVVHESTSVPRVLASHHISSGAVGSTSSRNGTYRSARYSFGGNEGSHSFLDEHECGALYTPPISPLKNHAPCLFGSVCYTKMLPTSGHLASSTSPDHLFGGVSLPVTPESKIQRCPFSGLHPSSASSSFEMAPWKSSVPLSPCAMLSDPSPIRASSVTGYGSTHSRPPSSLSANTQWTVIPCPNGGLRHHVFFGVSPRRSTQSSRRSQINNAPFRVLDAPNVIEDERYQLLDWNTECIVVLLGTTLYAYNPERRTVQWELDVSAPRSENASRNVTIIRMLPDSNRFLLGWSDGTIQIRRPDRGGDVELEYTCPRSFLRGAASSHPVPAAHSNTTQPSQFPSISAIAARENAGTSIAVGTFGGALALYDLRVARPRAINGNACSGGVSSLLWSPEGDHLACGSRIGGVSLWHETSSLRCPTSIVARHQSSIRSLAWSYHQRGILASASLNDGFVRIDNTLSSPHLSRPLLMHDTGTQIYGMLWSKTLNEIITAHGESIAPSGCPIQNLCVVWEVPSLLSGSRTATPGCSVLRNSPLRSGGSYRANTNAASRTSSLPTHNTPSDTEQEDANGHTVTPPRPSVSHNRLHLSPESNDAGTTTTFPTRQLRTEDIEYGTTSLIQLQTLGRPHRVMYWSFNSDGSSVATISGETLRVFGGVFPPVRTKPRIPEWLTTPMLR